jgi:preprotein translocase subunit SecA
MPGRRFSDGLHQALEAKEGVHIERDNQTLATITLQNYFRMYDRLAGMTGTAETEESEFVEIYDLDVVVIPTNRPIVRVDHEDLILRTKREKFAAIVDEIEECHKAGQPVLVGTVSVETSELISRFLRQKRIPHAVLNAKHHEKEAEIVANAGLNGAVTIATNMAGRGTDIKLGQGIADLGGLHIIGTERHEARRIDRQLRGRAGRQGDPGSSRFHLSLEDDLMRLFSSDRIAGIMDKLGLEEGEVIEHKFVTRAIEKAQRRVEEQNFGTRKHLLEYDNVMNKQREVIYDRRAMSLSGTDLAEECRNLVADIAAATVEDATASSGLESHEEWDWTGLRHQLGHRLGIDLDFAKALEDGAAPESLKETAVEKSLAYFAERESRFGPELFRQFERYVTLRTLDDHWKDHLYSLDRLREGIGLRAYGQKDPLLEYKKEAFSLFADLIDRIDLSIAERIMRTEIRLEEPPPPPTGVLRHEAPARVGAGAPGPSRQRAQAPPPPPTGHRAATATKVGRNTACPCGSGKKYKKCHGA